MPAQGPALAWCPFPDETSARAAVDSLLDEGLVACANLVPGIKSVFVWNGTRSEAEETAVLFKYDAAMMELLVTRLTKLHPYNEPAILAWRCDGAAEGTAKWLASLVR
jgi:periplasmic divalent cation tolerance protein